MSKKAVTDFPVHELIAERFSPYGFADKPVPIDDLRALFEAARWAASSFNEQPWGFIVARREDVDEFQRVLSCLVETNQSWARHAGVLVLTTIRLRFSRNDKPNRVALHDLGLAVASLTFEATHRGLAVHQMAGIDRDKARVVYEIPEGVEPATGIAIGYVAEPALLPDEYRRRDEAQRTRNPLGEFVYGGRWGQTSPLVE